MAYQIEITRPGSRSVKFSKNAINGQPHRFDAREDAQAFADSCAYHSATTSRINPAHLPRFRIVEVAA